MALLKLCFTLFPVGLSHFISSKFYYTQAHIYSLSFYFSIPSCPPSHFTYPRLFGMTGVIRTNSSDQHTLSLHPHVSWPDFINPLVLLLLYYTLVALLHKWVHITEEVCVLCVYSCVCQGNYVQRQKLDIVFVWPWCFTWYFIRGSTYIGLLLLYCCYYDICLLYYITTCAAVTCANITGTSSTTTATTPTCTTLLLYHETATSATTSSAGLPPQCDRFSFFYPMSVWGGNRG